MIKVLMAFSVESLCSPKVPTTRRPRAERVIGQLAQGRSICKSVCRGMNYGHVSKSGFPCLEGRKMSEHTSLAHVPHRIFSLWHLTLTQDDT